MNRILWTVAIGAFGVGGLYAAGTAPVSCLKNFATVDPGLYRGAQPSRDGFNELAKMGVRTVIDLREAGKRAKQESEMVQMYGMKYVNVPLDGFRAPTQEQVTKLLGLIEDPTTGPVFVHCRRGADRTGTILAIHRIEHDHWDNQKALTEAKSMKMAWSERLMRNLILQYKATPATIASN